MNTAAKQNDYPLGYFTVGHQIHLLSLYKDRLLEKHLAPFKVTPSQFKVMRLITTEGITNPAGLSRALNVDSGAMTRMTARLEQRGLIQRERCKEDRRQVILTATAAGYEFDHKTCEMVHNVLSELTANLSEQELKQFEHLLQKMLTGTGMLPDKFSCWSLPGTQNDA